MFLPYKIDVDLKRYPIATVFIMIVCLFVFLKQESSRENYLESLNYYCSESLGSNTKSLIHRLNSSSLDCPSFWQQIRQANDPELAIAQLVMDNPFIASRKDMSEDQQYDYQTLVKEYGYFEKIVSHDLTESLQYQPTQINFFKMITSTVAHASWWHLLGNLLFFYIFAAAVEVLVGWLVFLGIALAMSITTSLAYSLAVLGDTVTLPTIGLSGVVMGMMAMLAILVPKVRIKCFLWIIIYFKTFRIPALFIALWYIGWDFYDLKSNPDSGVNYIAHVSGAITGIAIAFFYTAIKPQFIKGLRT